MWRTQKELVAITAIVSSLTAPAQLAFADSKSPFGVGNPIEALSGQVDSLDKRVTNIEHPPVPTSISGVYAGNMILHCTERPLDPASPQTPNTYTIVSDGNARYNPDGTIEHVGTPTTVASVSSSNFGYGTGVIDKSVARYVMTKPYDGTFTYTLEYTLMTNGVYRSGPVVLQGRIFDGGKTLTLVSIEPQRETRALTISSPAVSERYCLRTNTLRRISD